MNNSKKLSEKKLWIIIPSIIVFIGLVIFLILYFTRIKKTPSPTTPAPTTPSLTTPSPTTSPLINSSLLFTDASQALITNSSFNILDLTSINTFTVEAWFFQISTFGNDSVTICADTTFGYTYYWSLSFNSSTNYVNFNWLAKDGKVYYIYHDGSQSPPNTLIPLNTWCHIALSVNNGSVSLFINGNKLNLDSNSAPSFINTSSTFTALTIGNLVNNGTMSLERVGTDYSEGISRDGSTQVSKHSPLVRDLSHSRFNLQGNLTNLRINNTKALYSSNFTPNFPLASIPGTSLLLLTQKNAPFADSSGNNVTVTVTPVGTPFPQVTSASPSSYPK